MVQIIPRQPTNIERFMNSFQNLSSGLGEGAETLKGAMDERKTRQELASQFGEKFKNIRNPDVQKLMLMAELEQQKVTREREKKSQALEDLKSTPYWKNASDLEKAVLEREILGDLSAQTSKSLVNLERERKAYDILSGLQGDEGMPPSESTAPSFGAEPGEEPRETKPPKRGQPKSDIEEQINKWRQVAANPNKDIRDFANKKIEDLRKEQEFSFKKEKFGHELEREHKEDVDKAYKAHEPFIQDVTNSYKGFESEMKPRLLQMQSMDPETLISPTASVFLEHLGIPLGALEDPHSELYQKLSQDLLKGLPETYGNRILKVEVDNFLKTIPQLMNSPDGRRMIASNMLKLGEMKEVYYKAMRQMQQDYLDSDKPLPKDFEQRIFDQVLPQINRINEEFVKLSEITAVPPNHVPFFDPAGNIKFVPKDQQEWASKNGGRRIW